MKGRKTGGRIKGQSVNKLPTLRAAYEDAFHALQSSPDKPYALRVWARANPSDFYKLAVRLIPTQITGAEDGPIQVESSNLEIARSIAFALSQGAAEAAEHDRRSLN